MTSRTRSTTLVSHPEGFPVHLLCTWPPARQHRLRILDHAACGLNAGGSPSAAGVRHAFHRVSDLLQSLLQILCKEAFHHLSHY